ncbi:MAG: YebC/PmpR family DNA-binding transcriptional regulator [Candidatus Omnitrophota bacterium]
MSGHSKWAGIKHKKAIIDAKRGKLFTKLIKEITVGAREGGGDMNSNPRLRTAVNNAKEANMPQDNIDRAIKKGTGELPGVSYESVIYEGYGPGGIAILAEVLTDNKNRTTAEIRNIFSKKGGSLAGSGSVAWLFDKKGFVIIAKDKIDEDSLMSVVLEAGAEDLKTEADTYQITCDIKDLEAVKEAIKNKNIEWQVAEITMLPSRLVKVEGTEARVVIALVDALEDSDDVQNVYSNFDIPDDILGEDE